MCRQSQEWSPEAFVPAKAPPAVARIGARIQTSLRNKRKFAKARRRTGSPDFVSPALVDCVGAAVSAYLARSASVRTGDVWVALGALRTPGGAEDHAWVV